MVHGIETSAAPDFHSFSADGANTPIYGSSISRRALPKYEMAETEMPAQAAHRFVLDELLLDGTPALNLASFVTTYMEPEAEDLMMKTLNKNFIDMEEYPSLGEIEKRVVNMVARLFHAPTKAADEEALGVSTVGSSEAIILATLAAKKRWQQMRKAAGKDYSKPNLIMSSAVQVCWEKAARYLDVEERYLDVEDGRYVLDPQKAVDMVDENTILICAIIGTTYTGEYEDVATLDKLLAEKNEKEGLSVRIHVDAASGGFVAPFVNPNLIWDFRLPNVCSINASLHKYGLTYAGAGVAIWRDREYLPQEIVFTINYLGADQLSFTLNFSKSGIQVVGAYYNFLRFGKAGYRSIMCSLTETSDYMYDTIEAMCGGKKFTMMSERSGRGLPLVAWRLSGKENYDEFAIARALRSKGWIVPAYTMAPKCTSTKMLRIVVREDMSRSRAETLMRDLAEVMGVLENAKGHVVDHWKDLVRATKFETAKTKEQHMGTSNQLNEKTGKDNIVC